MLFSAAVQLYNVQHNNTVAGDGSCLPQAAIDGKIALEDIGKRKESSEQVEPCGC